MLKITGEGHTSKILRRRFQRLGVMSQSSTQREEEARERERRRRLKS